MNEEWFDILDNEGNVVGCAPRNVCHRHRGLTHRAVHVMVFDANGRLFLQKRSAHKDIQPNRWDTSVGGHPGMGEDAETAARREMSEELGVSPSRLCFAFTYIWHSPVETEQITTFVTDCDGPFVLDPAEISEGRFWTMDELSALIGSDLFTPQFNQEFERLVTWRALHATTH